jgi:hypothetical protein
MVGASVPPLESPTASHMPSGHSQALRQDVAAEIIDASDSDARPSVDESLRNEHRAAARKLWKAVLALRRDTPTGFSAMDIYTEEEYEYGLQQEGPLLTLITEPNVRAWAGLGDDRLEEDRLILGEEAWKAFAAYRALLGRACLITARLRYFENSIVPWYRDRNCMRLLEDALGMELSKHIGQLAAGRLAETRRMFLDRISQLLRRSPV